MTWCSRLRRNSNSFSCGFCSPASAWLARQADSFCSTWRNFKTKKASRSSSKRRICSVDSSELLAGKGEKDGSASVFKKRWTASNSILCRDCSGSNCRGRCHLLLHSRHISSIFLFRKWAPGIDQSRQAFEGFDEQTSFLHGSLRLLCRAFRDCRVSSPAKKTSGGIVQ